MLQVPSVKIKKNLVYDSMWHLDILSETRSNEILGGNLFLLYEVLRKFLYICNHNKTKHDKNTTALAT